MNYRENNNNNYRNNVEYNYQNNNRNKDGLPLSYYIIRFLIGLLLIILLIFLLMRVFPTKATIKDTISDAINETLEEKLNPLYDRIFGDNIKTMKEVATSYFTTDRLPKAEGETKKLTLGEMLDMKLLLSVKDKNGNACDRDKSYVEVTKTGNEYKMKVNLSCGEEEDYIVSYLGCYNYCLADVCEKKSVEKITQAVYGGTGSSTTKYVNKTVTKTKVIEKHYCAIVNGKYYGKNGNIVTKDNYKKQCEPETKHYCAIVNGKYYGKYGKVVSKETYKQQCESQPEKHYCAIVNGKYYGKYGKVVSKETYKQQCEPEEKHYCAIVNGKYYGKYGKVVSKETYERQCQEKPTIWKYLYEKIVTIKHEREYSKWTDWSSNIEYDPNNNNINWGQHEFEWNEKVGYKYTKYYTYEADKSQPIYNETYDRLLGYKKVYACDGYNYFIDSVTNTTYQTTSTTTGSWSYSGRTTTQYKPSGSATKKYVYVGMNYDYCADTCTLKPYYIYDVYTKSSSTTTTTNKTSSTKESLRAVCSNISEKSIPIYGKRTTFAGYVTNKVQKEKRTYYYHRKTRTLIHDAYTETKKYTAWSYSDKDQILIDQGYKYTGHKEKVQ